jgi:predicted transcriptional regulator
MTQSDRVHREAGSLEAAVMEALWAADSPLVPAEVGDRVDANLAYTTVMTVLSRLHAKGMLRRIRQGRAFAYSPVQRADEQAADRMTGLLEQGMDRAAVLARFVERLAPEEEAVLRQLLVTDPRDGRSA